MTFRTRGNISNYFGKYLLVPVNNNNNNNSILYGKMNSSFFRDRIIEATSVTRSRARADTKKTTIVVFVVAYCYLRNDNMKPLDIIILNRIKNKKHQNKSAYHFHSTSSYGSLLLFFFYFLVKLFLVVVVGE